MHILIFELESGVLAGRLGTGGKRWAIRGVRLAGWSFLRNRDYTYVTAENCATIGKGPEFFAIDPEPVVTDRRGLDEALVLAWTDLAESLLWLLIVFANEIVIHMQARGSKQQYLYFWVELLWVCGFLVIESNLVAQRTRMRAVCQSEPSSRRASMMLSRRPPLPAISTSVE